MVIESIKIVYFSPTGTTKSIINAIAQGMNHIAVSTIDITTPEARLQRLQTSSKELLLIGMPVYFGRLQIDAIEWLQTIKAQYTPTVCVVVYGSREYDDALIELRDTMIKAGGLPVACAAFIGEHSWSSSEAPLAKNRPDTEDLNIAITFGKKIINKISFVSSIDDISEIIVPGKYPYKDITEYKKRFSSIDLVAVTESCFQCGVCSKNCPVGAIDSINSTLIDIEKCILCNSCVKMCSVNARKVHSEIIKGTAMYLSQTEQFRKEPICLL